MFVKAAKSTRADDERVEKDIDPASADERQRYEIWAHDFKEEISEANIAGADASASGCRMMDRMPQATHQTGAVQHKAMRNILHHVVADGQSDEAKKRGGERQMGGPHERKAGPLRQEHRRKQNERLIGEHAGKQFEIALPLHRARFETRQCAAAVEPFEPQSEPMIGRHLNEPNLRRERQ